ncbi:MAG: hypothetical protein ACLVB1_03845 [Blautia obeum]
MFAKTDYLDCDSCCRLPSSLQISVSLIAIFRARQVETSVYRRIHEHAGELTMSYEMYMTFMRKVQTLTHLQFVSTVVGYDDPKLTAFMGENVRRFSEETVKATVKIFTRLDPFLNVLIP